MKELNGFWDILKCSILFWLKDATVMQTEKLRASVCLFVVRYANWYHLYNLKNVNNPHGGVLILVKLQASACNFTKINTPPWVFSHF